MRRHARTSSSRRISTCFIQTAKVIAAPLIIGPFGPFGRGVWTIVACVALVGVFTPAAVFAQANRPLQVSSNNNQTASAPKEPVSADPLIRLAHQLAAKPDAKHPTVLGAADDSSQDARLARDSAQSSNVGRSRQRSPATSSDDSAVAGGPASGPAAPVVPVSANDRLPLGTAGSSHIGPGESPQAHSSWGVTQTLMALAIVVGLILLLRQVVLRWLGRPAAVNRSRVVEVLSRVSVGPRQHVVLLRMGSRIIVMADSAGQMRSLANIDEPEEVAAILKAVTVAKPSSASQGFGQLLGRFDREYDQEDDAVRHREEGEDVTEHHLDRTRDQLSGLLARVRAMAGKGGS